MPDNLKRGLRSRLEAETITIMRKSFSQIFWGLLIVVLDFSIGGFDLLIDGVGHILVAVGCGCLVQHSSRFKVAQTLAFVLTGLWLVGFAVSGDASRPFGLIRVVLDTLMIWYMFGGISELATNQELPELAQSAQRRRVAYALVIPGGWILAVAVAESRALVDVSIFLVISMFVVLGNSCMPTSPRNNTHRLPGAVPRAARNTSIPPMMFLPSS